MFKKLICKIRGHRWDISQHKEYVCVYDVCKRCDERAVVHRWGNYAHTCKVGNMITRKVKRRNGKSRLL